MHFSGPVPVRRITLLVSVATACALFAPSAGASAPVTVGCASSKAGALATGDVITDGKLGLAVPRPGTSVTVEEMVPNGARELRVSTASSGRVRMSGCGPESEDPATESPLTAKGGGGPCGDPAHSLYGYHWILPFAWSFDASSTPRHLAQRGTERTLEKATRAITTAGTSCSLLDLIGATAHYDGRTAKRANMSLDHGVVTCSESGDGVSVTDFGRLDGALARTCTWSVDVAGVIDVATQSDMRLNSAYRWTTNPGSRHCHGAWSVRAVATHERGHTFGLGHVSEGRHGELTMSTLLNGTCEDSESSLGLGDVRGLRSIY